jgi:hypothetical protein
MVHVERVAVGGLAVCLPGDFTLVSPGAAADKE